MRRNIRYGVLPDMRNRHFGEACCEEILTHHSGT